MPIFRVKSVKIYTGQKKFTRALPVAPVTNIRYAKVMMERVVISVTVVMVGRQDITSMMVNKYDIWWVG